MATTDEAAQRLAKHLTRELNSRGMTASDVGRAIGRSQPTVWRWMNGESLPDHASVELLQNFLGLRRGTVYRWAGLIDDDGLVDLDLFGPLTAEVLRAVIATLEADGDSGTSGQ